MKFGTYQGLVGRYEKSPMDPYGSMGDFEIESRLGLFHVREDAGEDLWSLVGEDREDLAVEGNTLYLHGTYELAVGSTLCAECGIHAGNPELAKIILLVLAVCKGV